MALRQHARPHTARPYDAACKAFEAVGATARSAHDLGHTSASHAAELLCDPEMMALYGWKDAEMARHDTSQVCERLALKAHERASALSRLSR